MPATPTSDDDEDDEDHNDVERNSDSRDTPGRRVCGGGGHRDEGNCARHCYGCGAAKSVVVSAVGALRRLGPAPATSDGDDHRDRDVLDGPDEGGGGGGDRSDDAVVANNECRDNNNGRSTLQFDDLWNVVPRDVDISSWARGVYYLLEPILCGELFEVKSCCCLGDRRHCDFRCFGGNVRITCDNAATPAAAAAAPATDTVATIPSERRNDGGGALDFGKAGVRRTGGHRGGIGQGDDRSQG